MNRRQFVSSLGVGAGSVHALQSQTTRRSERPNIVLLLTDDHHWQCLGAAGNPHVHTPNLNRLAARGVYFDNAICSTPQCCPSRGILLSGRETYQTGLISNEEAAFREDLGPTVVEQMRRSGYHTVLVGKWHVRTRPDDCGFRYAPLWKEDGADYHNPPLRRGLNGREERTPGWETDLLTDAAIDAISSTRRPFLLWLAYTAPHSDWDAGSADRRYRSIYEGKNAREIGPPGHPPGGLEFPWNSYYAVISQLDDAVGRLIRALEKAKLWENTVVFVLGDNGLTCGTKGYEGKVFPWEESIRVPLLAAGGPVKPCGRLNAPVASIDLPATWLDLAAVSPVSHLAGRSLTSYLQHGKGDFELAFSAWDDATYEVGRGMRVVPYRLVRGRKYKYIVWESGRQALYDWQADPVEESNLIKEKPLARPLEQLREGLLRRMTRLHDHARRWTKLKG